MTRDDMVTIKAIAQRVGDANLVELQKMELPPNLDLAILAYMFHTQLTACTRCTVASAEQVIGMLQVVDDVSAFARTETESAMREMGILRSNDG